MASILSLPQCVNSGYTWYSAVLIAGELYTEAAEAAMTAMKGKLANKYFALAEEAWALVEE